VTDRLAGMHVYAVYAVLDLALNSSRIRRILLNFGARAAYTCLIVVNNVVVVLRISK
jgi:hypothetical protein